MRAVRWWRTAAPKAPVHDPTLPLRRMLGGVLLLGMLAVAAELLLIEHDESTSQLAPLVALAAGLLTLVWDMVAESRASRLALRLAMLGLAASAVLGLYLHYGSNEEFQRELDPSLDGWRLVLATLSARSPPSLAPLVLGLLGALGWIMTHGRRHGDPRTRRTTT